MPASAPPTSPEGFGGFAEAPPSGRVRVRSERPRIDTAWTDRYGDRRQGLTTRAGWADDGFQTGLGSGSVRWSWLPSKGLGRVSVRLEGLRGTRWVAAENGGKREPYAREPAVSYWLWTEIETADIPLAAVVGGAVGVQAEGPSGALRLGLRSGLPHAGHARVSWTGYGTMGWRWEVLGAVPLTPALRVGPRVRIGTLPLHAPPEALTAQEEAWRQSRADGILGATVDLSGAHSLTLGGGLAGYDLLFADAGPVLDASWEVRW